MSTLEQKKLQLAEKRADEKEELHELKSLMGKDFLVDQLHTKEGLAGIADKIGDELLLKMGSDAASKLLPAIGLLTQDQLDQVQRAIEEGKEKLNALTEEQVDEELNNISSASIAPTTPTSHIETQETTSIIKKAQETYDNLTGEKPQQDAFLQAYVGLQDIIKTQNITNTRYLTIVDYTKGRSEDRLYVIDLEENKTLFHEQSGHGKQSGSEYANSFSNNHGSNQSSLGFMKISNNLESNSKGTWKGLRLYGLEDNINDQSDERGIFMHPGSVAGSLGCITLPKHSKEIMNIVKGGIVFSYDKNDDYLAQSEYLDDLDTHKLVA